MFPCLCVLKTTVTFFLRVPPPSLTVLHSHTCNPRRLEFCTSTVSFLTLDGLIKKYWYRQTDKRLGREWSGPGDLKHCSSRFSENDTRNPLTYNKKDGRREKVGTSRPVEVGDRTDREWRRDSQGQWKVVDGSSTLYGVLQRRNRTPKIKVFDQFLE